jgi:RNA polymerase sigma factor (sigma-70 family)
MSEAAAQGGFARLFSDGHLAKRAVGGDERAFAAIFRRYHQSLYRFCLAIVGNPEDAQDALQNTMMKVLRALPGEERQIELKPWLYRIAHNESVDLLRRRRETRELDAEQAAPGRGMVEDVATRERLRRLLADLRELPERQREVLVMRELAGLDFGEIGMALGTSGAVARQTLYEARQSLRQMEEGREMSCEAVTLALSDGDGRVTRRRDVRAHLRSCASCRHFRDEIRDRERNFAALAPLPTVAAAGMLQGLIGGAQGGAGPGLAATLGGGAAKSLGASAVVKGAATAAVVAAIGVTAADRSGVIHLGLPGDDGAKSSASEPSVGAAVPGGAAGESPTDGGASSIDPGAGSRVAKPGGHGAASPNAKAGAPGRAHSHGHGQAPPASKNQNGAHPQGKANEGQQAAPAAKGEEVAAGHKPPRSEPGSTGGEAATPPKPARPEPSQPSSPPAAAPVEPASPPAAPEEAPRAEATTPDSGPEASRGSDVAAEKAP